MSYSHWFRATREATSFSNCFKQFAHEASWACSTICANSSSSLMPQRNAPQVHKFHILIYLFKLNSMCLHNIHHLYNYFFHRCNPLYQPRAFLTSTYCRIRRLTLCYDNLPLFISPCLRFGTTNHDRDSVVKSTNCHFFCFNYAWIWYLLEYYISQIVVKSTKLALLQL